MKSLLKILRKIFGFFGYKIIRETTARRWRSSEGRKNVMEKQLLFLSSLPPYQLRPALENLPKSNSQIFQDIFALAFSDFKRGGFFLEFGATDGVKLSNTYLLEKEFGWTGILAEPGKVWHSSLRDNRTSIIDTRCVWRSSNETLEFVEAGQLSTIRSFSALTGYARHREDKPVYSVSTVSLVDLLSDHNAPTDIDYLSIDTEGSEFEILQNFDFSKYRIRVITCEHNYQPNREAIYDLLSNNGFHRVLENISGWDDWYVHESVMLEREHSS